MKEYIVDIHIRTNVTAEGPDFNGLDAINSAMGYGLGDLVAKGEYNFVGAEVEVMPVRLDDDEEGI